MTTANWKEENQKKRSEAGRSRAKTGHYISLNVNRRCKSPGNPTVKQGLGMPQVRYSLSRRAAHKSSTRQNSIGQCNMSPLRGIPP